MLILCYLIVAASFFVHVDPKSGEFTDNILHRFMVDLYHQAEARWISNSLNDKQSFSNHHALFVVWCVHSPISFPIASQDMHILSVKWYERMYLEFGPSGNRMH